MVVKVTGPEVLGPRLLPLTVQVTMPPPVAGLGAPDITAVKSAPSLIVVFCGSELLPVWTSGLVVEMLTRLFKVRPVAAVVRSTAVMVRTGRMRWFREAEKYMHDTPGLTRESANHLADRGAIVIGVDNISTDVGPSKEANNWVPVHSAMLSQRGVPIMQNVNLEQLAADQVYTFAWIGAPLKLRGADGAPMRPIALPIR